MDILSVVSRDTSGPRCVYLIVSFFVGCSYVVSECIDSGTLCVVSGSRCWSLIAW